MEISYRYRNSTITVHLAGAIDHECAQEFQEELKTLLTRPFTEVVFDFSMVTMFSSSAIGKLVMYFKQSSHAGKKMRVKGVNEYIYNLFQFSSLDLLFPIER